MDENEIINDSLNDESNFEQEVEQTFDNANFSTIQNDDACVNVCKPNTTKANNDQGLSTGAVNKLETNIGNDNGSMDSDNDILQDPLLSSSTENHVTSSSYQDDSSNESNNPYDFSDIVDTLHGFRKTISFSRKQLVSLK